MNGRTVVLERGAAGVPDDATARARPQRPEHIRQRRRRRPCRPAPAHRADSSGRPALARALVARHVPVGAEGAEPSPPRGLSRRGPDLVARAPQGSPPPRCRRRRSRPSRAPGRRRARSP
jgi:hypothetical protein